MRDVNVSTMKWKRIPVEASTWMRWYFIWASLWSKCQCTKNNVDEVDFMHIILLDGLAWLRLLLHDRVDGKIPLVTLHSWLEHGGVRELLLLLQHAIGEILGLYYGASGRRTLQATLTVLYCGSPNVSCRYRTCSYECCLCSQNNYWKARQTIWEQHTRQ